MTRPDLNAVHPILLNYVNYVKDMDVIESLEYSLQQMVALMNAVPEEKGEYRYGNGKWSIKEVLNHLMDVERIFSYRALRFSRNDATPIPGFQENDYAPEANAHSRTIKQLMDELIRLRASTTDLFRSFTPAMLSRTGFANGNELQVLTLGYAISGHESHHRKILQERYLTI